MQNQSPAQRGPHPNMMSPFAEQQYPMYAAAGLASPVRPTGSPSNPRFQINAGATPFQASPVASGAQAGKPTSQPQLESIPVITEAHKKLLALYQHRDERHQAVLNTQHKRHEECTIEKKNNIKERQYVDSARTRYLADVFGRGYSGYGNGETGVTGSILYPNEFRKQRRGHEFKFTLSELTKQATKDDDLVPIRIEHDNLQDTFTWNLNESLITPAQFADVLCNDLLNSKEPFSDEIKKMIEEQIDVYKAYLQPPASADQDSSVDGKLEEDKIAYSPKIKTESPSMDIDNDVKYQSPEFPEKRPELRTLIKLDITVGNRALIDQFEWDISCQENSPEDFAEVLATELGLGGEFKTAIAHSIREQILVHRQHIIALLEEDEVRQSVLAPVRSVLRRDPMNVEEFTPAVLELTETDVEKAMKDQNREMRLSRRRRRDKHALGREPKKTLRTLVVAPQDSDRLETGVSTSQGGTPRGGADPPKYQSQRQSARKARANISADAAGNQRDYDSPAPESDVQAPTPRRPAFQEQRQHQPQQKCSYCGITPVNSSQGEKAICAKCRRNISMREMQPQPQPQHYPMGGMVNTPVHPSMVQGMHPSMAQAMHPSMAQAMQQPMRPVMQQHAMPPQAMQQGMWRPQFQGQYSQNR